MIGKVDEAKEKLKTAKPDADSKTKGKSETPPAPAANPQPEANHAAGTHAS